MGKPCILSPEHQEMGQLIAQVPDDVLSTPEQYALYLAARNTPETSPDDFATVAGQVNARFSLTGQESLTPQKLGKLLKQPDAVMAEIAQAWEERQQVQRQQPQPPPTVAEPAPSPNTSKKIEYTHPGMAASMLAVAEFAAYARGDQKTRDALAAINREVRGEAYENPLIKAAEMPQRYVQGKHQQFEHWLEESLTKDRTAKQQAVETIKGHVNATWQAAVETDQKVKGALGGFFQTAQNIGQAIATRFHEDRQLLSGQETAERAALFNRLKNAARE